MVDRTSEEADADALRAATAFRSQLVEQGILKEARAPPTLSSEVCGVFWNSHYRSWVASISLDGRRMRSTFLAETDDPEDIEYAKQSAEEQRKDWECEFGVSVVTTTGKPRQMVQRKSGAEYVRWDAWAECWRVQVQSLGPKSERVYRSRNFAPE